MANGAKKSQYAAEAAANRREASTQQIIGANDAAKVAKDVNRVIGQNIAANAANGVAQTGSAQDVLAETAREGDLDIQTIQWNAGQKVDKLKYAAQVADMNKKAVGRAAPFEFLAPVLDSAVKISGMYAKA